MKISKKWVSAFFILVFVTWCFYLFNLLKYAKEVDKVTIKVDKNFNFFNNLNIYSISPNDNVRILKSNFESRTFYPATRQYFKQIKVSVPAIYSDAILRLNIKIDKVNHEVTKKDLDRYWEKEEANGVINYYSPKNIRGKTSIIPLFKGIINWKGDFYLFGVSLLKIFLILLFVFFIAYLLGKRLFGFLDDIAPKKVKDIEIIRYYKNKFYKKIVQRVYIKDREGYYILKSNLTKIDKIGLFFIFYKISTSKMFYLTAIVTILFIALFIRMVLIQFPYSNRDVHGYLRPALSSLTGDHFQHFVTGRFLILCLYI